MSSQILFYLICIVGGYFLRYIPGMPRQSFQWINKFIIYLPLPAITLYTIPSLSFESSILLPIVSAWIMFIAAFPFAYLFKRHFNFGKATFACLVLVCGLGNTSFVGYPIMTYLFGEESLQYAILVDQPGTFLMLSTGGILLATTFGGGKVRISSIFKRLIAFPPFLAFLVALFIPIDLMPQCAINILKIIGSWMVPLALVSLGLQFQVYPGNIRWSAFVSGLFYKLIIGPLIVYILLFIVLKKTGFMYEVTVLECAMPPMITASIIANEYNLDGQLANALATYGIPISLATLYIWNVVL